MGQTVYTENDSANFLYVLYQGECVVKKNIDFNNMKEEEDYFNKNDNNKNKIYNDKNLKTLFRVGAGCVLGLETIIPNSNYLTNLIASHDFTILYKMKLSELKKFSFEPKFLEPMLKIQIQLIEESIKKEENTFKLKNSLQNKFNLRFGNVNYIVTEFAESVLNEIKNKKEHDKKYKTKLEGSQTLTKIEVIKNVEKSKIKNINYKTPEKLIDSLKYEPNIYDLIQEDEFVPKFSNIKEPKSKSINPPTYDINEYIDDVINKNFFEDIFH